MRLALILSIISAGLSLCMVCMVDPTWPGDAPSERELLISLLYFPNLFLSLGCLIYSIVKLTDKQQRGKAFVVLALSCIMPTWGSYEVLYPKWKRDDDQWAAPQRKAAENRQAQTTAMTTAVPPVTVASVTTSKGSNAIDSGLLVAWQSPIDFYLIACGFVWFRHK